VVDAEMTKQKACPRAAERRFLGTIGNNGPFIGLVGTVLGVIQAFQQLGSQSKDAMGNVMVGIAEALIATASASSSRSPPSSRSTSSIARSERRVNVNIMMKYVAAQLTSKAHVALLAASRRTASAREGRARELPLLCRFAQLICQQKEVSHGRWNDEERRRPEAIAEINITPRSR